MQPTLKSVCSRLGFALFIFLLAWNLAAILFTTLLVQFIPNLYESNWGLLLVNDLSLYAVGAPIFLLIIARLPNHTFEQNTANLLPFWKYAVVLLFCFGIMYGVGFLTEFFFLFLERVFSFEYTNSLETLVNVSDWPALLIFGVAVPAVGEEFIFRYMLYRKLSGYGDKVYILFSALCFGIFHINPSQILYAFLLGLVLAGVYVHTKRLWVPISLHFLLNSLGLLIIPNLVGLNETIAYIFSGFMFILFPISIIFLITFYRKLPKVHPLEDANGITLFTGKRSFVLSCIFNLGMLLYLGTVCLLLTINLWAT